LVIFMKRVSGRVPAVRERRQEQQRPVPGRNLIEQPDKRVDRHDGPFLGVLLPGANMEAAIRGQMRTGKSPGWGSEPGMAR
jgi:hypothetical protein